MVNRILLMLWCLAWIEVVVAQVPATLQFTLFHQLVHSESVEDILPRGIIKYDSTTNSATYEAQSKVIDFASGKGVYRIGIYDQQKKELSPAAFTKLVSLVSSRF
jgi:hypothetical protein